MPTIKLRLHQQHAVTTPNTYHPSDTHACVDDKMLSLLDCLNTFLLSSKQILLIHGPALIGKTSFCHWVQANTEQTWFPIYIPLTTLDDPHTVVETALQQCGLTSEEVLTSYQLPLLFIFDGYDELGHTQNLYVTNQLHRWPYAKSIITTRSLYLINDPLRHLLFTPFYHETARLHLLETVEMMPLPLTLIQVKIEQYLINHSIDEASTIHHLLCTWMQQHVSLSVALLSPLFLNAFIQILSKFKQQQSSSDEIDQLLLQTFMQSWFDYHQSKQLFNHVTHANTQHSLTLENYLAQLAGQISALSGKLPLRLLTRDLFAASQNTLSDTLFDWDNRVIRIVFAQCPIQLESKQSLVFWHERMADVILTHDKNSYDHQTLLPASRQEITSATCVPILSLKDRLEQDPFNLKNYVPDTTIISFLADSLLVGDEHSQSQRKRLFMFLNASKKNAALTTAAANAMTVLNAAQEIFSGMDLRDIHVAGANLEDIIAEDADFTGADLCYCILIGAYLARSQFQFAKMSHIIWGELGTFSWTTGSVLGLSFIKNNQELMAWGEDNTIAFYNTPFNLAAVASANVTISQNPIDSFSYHEQKVFSAIHSVNGRYVVSTGRDRVIRVIDFHKKQQYALVNLAKDDDLDFTYLEYFPIVFTFDELAIIYAKETIIGNYRLYQQALNIKRYGFKDSIDLSIGGFGHVRQLAYISSDNLALVIDRMSRQSCIAIYNLQTKALVKEFSGYLINISQQHQQMAVAVLSKRYHNLIKLYRMSDFSLLHVIKNTHATARHSTMNSHTTIRSLQYVPNRAQGILVSAGDDGCILFWDIHSKRLGPILTLRAHAMPITSIAFSTDGQILASASGILRQRGHGAGDRTIRVFSTATLLAQEKLQLGHQGEPAGMVVARQYKAIYSAGYDGFIHCWSFETGKNLRPGIDTSLYNLERQDKKIRSLCLLSDCPDFVELIVLFDSSTWLFTINQLSISATKMNFNDGSHLSKSSDHFAVSDDNTRHVRVHHHSDIAAYQNDGEPLFSYQHKQTKRVAFSRDSGKTLALLCGSHVILLDGFTGEYHYTIDGITGVIVSEHSSICDKTTGLGAIEFSEIQPNLLGFVFNNAADIHGYETNIILWDTQARTCLMSFHGRSAYTNVLRFSPSGQYMLIGDDEGYMSLWHIPTRQKVCEQIAYSRGLRIQDAAFINDEQIVIHQGDGSLKAWQLTTTTENRHMLRLFWCSNHELIVNQADFDHTQGLTPLDQWVLKSREASFFLQDMKADMWIKKGQEQLESAEHVQAIVFFSRAINLNAKCAAAYLGRGLCYQSLNQMKEAEDDFTRSISFADSEIKRRSLYQRGMLYLRMKMGKSAENDLNNALHMTTDHSADNTLSLEQINDGLNEVAELERIKFVFDQCHKGKEYRFSSKFNASDIHRKNQQGLTLLHIAVSLGHLAIVKKLLDAGADPAMPENKFGDNALIQAVKCKIVNLAIYRALINKDAGIIDICNNRGLSALDYAKALNLTTVVSFLRDNQKNICKITGVISGPLIDAIQRRDVANFKRHLDHGENYMIKSNFGVTPLHVICYQLEGDTNTPTEREALYQMGCLLMEQASQDGKPLDKTQVKKFTDYRRQHELSCTLSTHSLASPEQVTQPTMANPGLASSSTITPKAPDDFSRNLFGLFNNSETQTDKLKTRLNVYKKSNESQLPNISVALRRAAATGRAEDVTLFLQHGAQINEHDTNPMSGKTALHHAAERGHASVVTVLLQRGAAVNARDNNPTSGKTALHLAYINKHMDVAAILLARGADPDLVDAEGKTPQAYQTSRAPTPPRGM